MSRRVVPILNSYKRPPDRNSKAVTSRNAKGNCHIDRSNVNATNAGIIEAASHASLAKNYIAIKSTLPSKRLLDPIKVCG